MSTPILTVQQLTTPTTEAEELAGLYTIAGLLGLKTTAWQRLSPLRTIFAIVANRFAGFSVVQALVNRSGFLDLAEGVWLTLLAIFVYGVTRILASFASGEVTINNSAGGLYSFGVGDLLVLNSGTGKTYANTSPVTINPMASGLVVPIAALESGSASTSEIGDIDAFVSASPSLSVTNAARVVGEDEETDPALRVRAKESLGALSPGGPALAIQYVAKTPSLNGGVQISRVFVRPAEGNGTVRVVVAGPNGVVSGPDLVTLAAKLNQLAIVTGYTLLLSSASVLTIQGDATLYVSTSSALSADDAKAQALDALRNYVPTIPIGGVIVSGTGKVLYRGLEAAIVSAVPGVLAVKLDDETDTTLTATQVAGLEASPTFTVEFVTA